MILVTGGAGYIGSHACVALLSAGEDVVIFDNFCNSKRMLPSRIAKICGKAPAVVEGDIRNQAAIEGALIEYGCTAVMHFAGLKSMGTRSDQPLDYYDNNVVGTPASGCNAKCAGAKNHFQLVCDRVWDLRIPPLYRGSSAKCRKPLWQNQACGRGYASRSIRQRSSMEHGDPALFQSSRHHESGLIGEIEIDIPTAFAFHH